MKKNVVLVLVVMFFSGSLFSQPGVKAQILGNGFVIEKSNKATPVKDQSKTNSCWSYSTTSLIESQFLKYNNSEIDLSEMFTVYNIYIEKGKNYLRRMGNAQFGEGGLGHDVIRSVSLYGAMPESVFSGVQSGAVSMNHGKLVIMLKNYLDGLLKSLPLADNWMDEYKKILNEVIGTPPTEFAINGKKYSPKTYSTEILKFKSEDYVNITSFTDHKFYSSFILDVPDNFSNGSYYNIPMNEMIQVVKNSINKGYTVMWDTDVSNSGFSKDNGLALFIERRDQEIQEAVTADTEELKWDVPTRQKYFENLTTQDDHLMHITGIEKSKKGKTFFIVKNSWGINGPYNGYVNVSEAYFAMNTISLVVPKESIDKILLLKMGVK